MFRGGRDSPRNDEDEQNPFLSPEETSTLRRRSSRSTERREQRFSLQDMEYPDTNIPLDSHPLLVEAVFSQPDLLQQGMGEALGLDSAPPSWLPDYHETDSGMDENSTHDGADHMYSPDALRDASRSHIYSRQGSTHSHDRDLTYEIPMITLNTADVPETNAKENGMSDLESGLYSRPESPLLRESAANQLARPPPGSPSKFSGFITRISDRIAGTDHPQTPVIDKNISSFWNNEHSDHLPRPSIVEGFSYSFMDESANASSASFLGPSLPFIAPHERSHYSSMESIHSVDAQGENRAQDLNKTNTHLSPTQSAGNLAASGVPLNLSPKKNIVPNASNDAHFVSDYNMSLHGMSLGMFGPKSPIRNWCHKVVSHKFTNLIVTLVIIIQTIILAKRQWNPMKNYGYYFDGYSAGDYILIVINCLYTAELAMKTIAYGLYNDKIMFKNLGIEYPRRESFLGNSYVYSFLLKLVSDLFLRLKQLLPKSARIRLGHKKDQDVLSSSEDVRPEFVASSESLVRKNPFSSANVSGSNFSASGGSEPAITLSSLKPREKSIFKQNTFFRLSYLGNILDDLQIKRAVLRDNWQMLDFIAIISFWISMPMSLHHWDANNHVMIFRALGCLRILRLCKLTAGTNMILRACESCLPQLIDVGIFIACFWIIIGIVGVQSFKSSLTRHCVWTNPEDPSEIYIDTDLYCGSYLGTDGEVYSYIDRNGKHAAYPKGYTCPVNSVCRSGENPYDGTVNFDNILQSMQMVFVMISVNTFSDIMYNLTDTDTLAASLFYIVGIFILTVWLMNIFTAIIVSSFRNIQLEAAEEEKRGDGKLKRRAFFKLIFRNEFHNKKVLELIQKKPLLKTYYRFEFIFIFVIIASLVTQMFRDSSMSEARAHKLYRAESAFTSILLFEIILRFLLYVPHIKTFFMSKGNCVDLFLAIITSIIILDPIKNMLGHTYYWLTFFQCARFYRVVLSSKITSDLWMRIFQNFKPIYDLTLFYFILLFLSGIIISRYFEGTIPSNQVDTIVFAMHTLPNTLMSLYVITSTENWATIMYGLQEYASNTFQRAVGSMLITLWFIITNLIVMNVFIAVIAASMEISIEGRKKYQVRHFIDDMTERLQTVRSNPGWIQKLKSKAFKPKEEKNMEKAITNLLLSGRAVNEFLDGDELEAEVTRNNVDSPKNGFSKWWASKVQKVKKFCQNPFYYKKSMATDISDFNPAEFATRVITERRKLIYEQDQYLKENPNFNTVFYVMGPRHKLRRLCQKIVPSSYGERIDGTDPNKVISEIFSLLMFLSTIGIVATACYQTPLYRSEMIEKHGKWNWTFYIDTCFMGVFTIEFLVKVIADGFLFTPNAYVRSSWNWLDFGALLSLWIEFIAFLQDNTELSRIVRGLKALRALRILTISETAKNNFHYTMISGFGKILSAAIISLTLLIPFSVWGLNIFNGRLGYCLDGSSAYSECYNEYRNEVFDWEIVSPNVYVQPELDLDDFKSSFSTLYQIVSLEGWGDLLINVMQSTGEGTPQKMFASPVSGLFVIFFNFISTVFILTLFVSVIINNYSKVTGRAYLTPVQVQWYHVKKFLLQVKPSKRVEIESLGSIRRHCYMITVEKNKIWSIILNSGLILHIFVLLLEAFPAVVPNNFRYSCFMIVSSIFLAHYIMLIIAQTPRGFMCNKWNIFSLLVVFGAFTTTILAFFINSDNLFINFNKTFLVGLLIFLFPRSDRLNQLMKFTSASLPSLFSLIFTWFVIFIMYAIAMNQIFGMTKIGPNTSGNINFRSVPKALILLFRCSFGEGWNYVMDDFTLEEPFCLPGTSSEDSDCGSKEYAYFLFMSWNVISMYIMLNLFVSLILDSFSYIAGGKQYAHLISRPEIRRFKKCWQKFDPEGTGYIPSQDLSRLLHLLDGALSFHFYSGMLSVPELCSRWITRNSLSNPYDIDINYEEINLILLLMNIPKIQERRKAYEQFTEKAIMNMQLREEPGISFTNLLVQIPLYSSFNQSECLIFIDYMEADLMEKKVAERMRKKRCNELIEGYVCRWRYLRWKHGKMLKEEFLTRDRPQLFTESLYKEV